MIATNQRQIIVDLIEDQQPLGCLLTALELNCICLFKRNL